jgi:hypothetical protein
MKRLARWILRRELYCQAKIQDAVVAQVRSESYSAGYIAATFDAIEMNREGEEIPVQRKELVQ